MNIIMSIPFRFKQISLICSIFIFSTIILTAQNFAKHTIKGNFNGSNSIHAIDLDGDGDIDVLGSAFVAKDITWFENDGNQNFTENIIDGSFNGAKDVFAIDMDGDGDIDVIGAANVADEISWWENDGNENFTKHIIKTNLRGVNNLFAIDVDGDGDIDVLSTDNIDDEINWYENDGSENFTKHTIKGNFDSANSVYAIDVDGDGDIDVLGTAEFADDVTWFENDGNENFTEHIIKGDFDGAFGVFAEDIDSDGDIDIVSTAKNADDVTWFENDGNENFTEHIIKDNFNFARSVFAIDVNDDGFMDVIAAAGVDDDIIWFENDGEENFTEHTIIGNFDGAIDVFAIDVDGDNDIDILGAANIGDDITWFESDFAPPPPFIVTNTDDAGAGSLRQAMLDANGQAGISVIEFNILGAGVHTISLLSSLPIINEHLILNGNSQPGFAGVPIIELDGSAQGAGDILAFDGAGRRTVVKGFIINGSPNNGISMSNCPGGKIDSCYIGTDATGMAIDGNSAAGVLLSNSDKVTINKNVISGNGTNGISITGTSDKNIIENCIVGLDKTGTTNLGNTNNGILLNGNGNNNIGSDSLSKRNIISGNTGNGIEILTSNNIIKNNYIGTDKNGNVDLGNGLDGILINNTGVNNVIGTPAAGNVISGNNSDGIEAASIGNTPTTLFQNNIIGLNATGSAAIANSQTGIRMGASADNIKIGGTATNEGNVISGNGANGILASLTDGTNIEISGNFIGIDAGGTLNLGNTGSGILFSGATNFNIDGSTNANTIAFNGDNGIKLDEDAGTTTESQNISIFQNSIFSNITKGIFHTAAQAAVATPILTEVVSGNKPIITGTLVGKINTAYIVEFFKNTAANGSGNHEGKVFLDSTIINTDGTGNALIDETLNTSIANGEFVTATATEANQNTSEFSNGIVAQALAKDVTITSITHIPVSSPCFGNVEIIQVDIVNNGAMNIAIGDATITLTGQENTPLNLTNTLLLADGETETIIFTVDISVVLKTYNLIATATLAGDLNANNNVDSVEIINDCGGLVVTNTNDAGVNSLRAAITTANASSGHDTIVFAISNAGVQTISLLSALPIIIDDLTIDGTSQPSFLADPIIELDGSGQGNGDVLSFDGIANAIIKSLIINNSPNNGISLLDCTGGQIDNCFVGTNSTATAAAGNDDDGILLENATNVIIQKSVLSANGAGIHLLGSSTDNIIKACKIGTDKTGTAALGNTKIGGINIATNSNNNIIGGDLITDRNIISGNIGRGISISGDNNIVKNNYIGTDSSGTVDLGNVNDGVSIFGDDNIIGTPVAGNLISGNNDKGVKVFGGSVDNIIQNNIIGLDKTGTADLGNNDSGIELFTSSARTQVGGANANEGNLISGNGDRGITIFSGQNKVEGCKIGTDINGTAAIPNTNGGIRIFSASSNNIGTPIPGGGNLISGNGFSGISTESAGVANLIQNNIIGLNITGDAALGNSFGISMTSTSVGGTPNKVGGTDPNEGNVISGNINSGIFITSVEKIIAGNKIGTDITGTVDLGNGDAGIFVNRGGAAGRGGEEITIENNLISGNDLQGVFLDSDTRENILKGNKIGTDITGTLDLGNTLEGIKIKSSELNIIGTSSAGEGNLISGNDNDGIFILNGGADNNIIHNNIIGLNITGDAALGNGDKGIAITESPRGTQIGGAGVNEGNIISDNTNSGIIITGKQHIIKGNKIGTNAAGTAAFGNGGDGITLLDDADNNQIGGSTVAERNIISGNGEEGIKIADATGTIIQGNFIGTNAAGTAALSNGSNGISTEGDTTKIGGTNAGEGNLISGNSENGIDMESDESIIQGNIIGLNTTGTAAIANELSGISIISKNTLIGGASATAGNVISGNIGNGIVLENALDITIQGNFIGTNALGNAAIGNSASGIILPITFFGSDSEVIIGGKLAGEGNVISGNEFGIFALFTDGTNVKILGNSIGTDINGTIDLGNGADGILMLTAANFVIGDTTVAGQNTIAFNDSSGISVVNDTILGSGIESTNIQIPQNSIFDNGTKGIAYIVGQTAVARPVLTSAISGANPILIGTLLGKNSTAYTIDFFKNTAANASGNHEGKVFLESRIINTNAAGIGIINEVLTVAINDGEFITATAAGANENTSEFSVGIAASSNVDNCPNDPNKTQPDQCGCGVADTDTDMDGAADCIDDCPNDPNKTQFGSCGCGVAETDTDMDGTADCIDNCPNDANKTEPGDCGCGVDDTDTDDDQTADCIDNCPNDVNKTEPGDCGCGEVETDSDMDGIADCIDNCPNDATNQCDVVCSDMDLVINEDPITGNVFATSKTINSTGRVDNDSTVVFRAAMSITLNAGFHAEAGSNFTASIEACGALLLAKTRESEIIENALKNPKSVVSSEANRLNEGQRLPSVKVFPNPMHLRTTLEIMLSEATNIYLNLYDLNGRKIATLVNGESLSKGVHNYEWQCEQVQAGMYLLVMNGRNVGKLVVVR